MGELANLLAQLPADYEVVIKSKTGTVTYKDRAGDLLEDDGKLIRLEDFELVSDIKLPNQTGGTLAELLAEEIEPVRFVINNLIPEGLTLLAGKPKLGKSWLALLMSLCVSAGDNALGHHTKPAEVLYIALEDGKRRMQERVRILDGHHLKPDALARFHYRTEWPVLNEGGIEALEEWMETHPDTGLVVIDTYGKIQGQLAGKNRYTEEYQLLGKLQSFASHHRIAIMLIHHLRKQGADDWLEQLSGSQAVTGAADTLLGLFRERGQMDATLRLVSREVDEKDLALKFDSGRWKSMGDAAAYRMTVERSEVLEVIEALGGKAKVSDVASVIHKTPANTSYLLGKMQEDRHVRKVGHGVYALLTHPLDSLDSLKSKSSTSSTSRGLIDQQSFSQSESQLDDDDETDRIAP